MGSNAGYLIAGAAILGGLGYLAHQESEKRKQFQDSLAKLLSGIGLGLVNIELGRKLSGEPIWSLTIKANNNAYILKAEYPTGTDPYADVTVQNLASRVSEWRTRALVSKWG